MISYFEVDKPHISNLFSYSSYFFIFPTCKINEFRCNQRIRSIWVSKICSIIVDGLTRIDSRDKLMEYSQTIFTIGMCNIIGKFSKLGIFWTYSSSERGSHGIRLSIEPIAITIRTSCMIASENIVWVCNPETSRCLICYQQTEGSFSLYSEIALNEILCFNSILNKECMSHSVIGYILSYS